MGAFRHAGLAGRILLATLLCLMLSLRVAAAEPKFPPLTGRVVDDAGILTPATVQQISAMSAEAERRSSIQIVAATVKSLQGLTIEEYGYQLGRYWGIGQKGKNNGVILLVAPQDRAVRIEVGYGLEGTLTDAQSKIIIENVILPRFRAGDFNAGLLNGTDAVARVVTGEAIPAPSGTETPGEPQDQFGGGEAIIFIVFFLLFIFGRGFFWPLLFMGGIGGRHGRDGFSGGGSFGGGGASGKW